MRNKIKYSVVGFFVLIFISGFSQQLPLYNLYQINQFTYNPSLAGYTDKTNAYFIRNQKYLGFDGGNISNILTVDGKIFDDKIGLGFTVFNDQMGLYSSQGAGLTFAYRVKFSDKVGLGFGLTGGATDRKYNMEGVIVKDLNDPTLSVVLPARKTYFDLAAGLYLDIADFQLGISVPQLIGNDLVFSGQNNINLSQHFMAHMRYNWLMSEKLNLFLIPNARAMFVPGAPIQYDVNIMADMKNIAWISAGYRSNYAVSAAAGVRIKKNLMFGYAYNFVMNTTNAYGPTNQEIIVGYSFGVKNNDKEKKMLEEAQKEIERLQAELKKIQTEKDSVVKEKDKSIAELNENMQKKEVYYNDTINKLNDELNKLKEEMKNMDKKDPVVDNPPTNDKDPEIKRSKDDHFIELDKTDSPKGYYVILGAYGKMENAQSQFNALKAEFPEARIIFNERNGLNYILLIYSEQKPPVFEVRRKAHSMGHNKAWILDYR